MGNDNSAAHPDTLKNFNMQKYMNQGLRQQEIIKIKEAFDAYQPVNGRIDAEKLRKSTEQSGNK